jgi:hypothetical protein
MAVASLSGVWTPRRDARGLFVPKIGNAKQVRDYESPVFAYLYPTRDDPGIYLSPTNEVLRNQDINYGVTGALRSAKTPFGPGIDVPQGWQVSRTNPHPGGWSVINQTWISLFYLYDATKLITGSPPVFGGSITWQNVSGEQSLVVTPDTVFGGVATSITGVGNGLHCMVVCNYSNKGAAGVRIFLNGALVATTRSSDVWNSALFPSTDWYGASISQQDKNVGNILFSGYHYSAVFSDVQAAALSLDPYGYVFRNAPSTNLRAVRNMTFDGNTYQSSRPTADISNSGWVRVP